MKITSIPQVYRNINRWREMISVLSKYGLADWISRFDLQFAKGILKHRDGEALARLTRERRVRLALTDLGPTFIKLGQIFSTRPDVIGVALAEELAKLQDDVPGDPMEVVRRTIESELGQPVDSLFARFDECPIASASIGQVHRAELRTGEAVAVKVQHPGVADQLRTDMDILAGLAQLAERIPELSNYRPLASVGEFQRIVGRELDFRHEQRNLQQFSRQLSADPTVRIPKVYPELSTRRVLTMEFLDGVKLSDTAGLGRTGYDLQEVSRRGVRLYLEMMFAHGRYHADPHPGNILLMDEGVIGLIDFGMVGRIDERLREDVEEIVVAISDGDADYLTSMITRIGAVPLELDHAALELDMSDFVGYYTNLPLDEVDLSAALNEMTEMIRRYQIMLPARIAMLLKVLVMLEGTSRLVSPTFNLLDVMRPYRRKTLLRRLAPARQMKRMRRIYSEVEHLATSLPRRIAEILQQVQSGKFDVHLDHRGLEPSVNRLVLGMLASALFLGSSLMLSLKVGPLLGGVSILGVGGCAVSLLLGLRLLRAINKSGRLDRKK